MASMPATPFSHRLTGRDLGEMYLVHLTLGRRVATKAKPQLPKARRGTVDIKMVRLAGLEPALPAPEAGALSAEL